MTKTTRRFLRAALPVPVLLLVFAGRAHAADPPAGPANASPPIAAAAPSPRTLTIDTTQSLGRYYRFWTVSNCVEPDSLVGDGIPQQLACTPLMREINCDFMMGGMWEGKNQWFLGTNPDGSIRADFTGMIAQLKAIQTAGYSPRVVLEDVPDAMSDPATRHVYGNTAPPKDEKVWHAYIQLAVETMVKNFGEQKVKTWTFRVGTEPDLYPDHWSGTKEQYFAHYDYTVDAIRKALPGARVGPGNILQSDGKPLFGRRAAGHVKWGLDIIDHCAIGKNSCTGAVGAPMDVFLTSWYENVGMPTSAFNRAITDIQNRLAKYPQFKNIPVEVGEFSVLRDEHNKHLYAGESSEWSASFYASLADRAYALNVAQIYEWDDATLGVWHPQGRVIQMLDTMVGGQRLAVDNKGSSTAECGALACRQGDDLLLLVYNHRPERAASAPEAVHLVIHDPGMVAGAPWHLTEKSIDHDHAVWAYAFEADAKAANLQPLRTAGLYESSPNRLYGPAGVALFQKNIATYTKLSEVPITRNNIPVKTEKGSLALDLTLPTHAVRFLRLSPK